MQAEKTGQFAADTSVFDQNSTADQPLSTIMAASTNEACLARLCQFLGELVTCLFLDK
jgi:hypothetical protein